ncbi:AAA family ATPase [Methylomonas rosea]|uniref:AAA family ATPase n=1 Tax=Methylomonas rosea TaxID=2952227 RepID=A0ABT1TY34_9GAMM|nr:ATP-binding protein [Methylomonas sp. WSC-7]MCQ8119445.1 AAA family ATPase [Methylomonas sp. WSC-7]
MLTNLRIKNFRMLEDLKIPRLGRVNLIVGKNNSGKSSILEAIRIYTEKADRDFLREILINHDESVTFDHEPDNQNPSYWYGLKNLFYKREFSAKENAFISISSDEKNLIQLEYVFYYQQEEIKFDKDGNEISKSRKRIPIHQSELPSFLEQSDTELIPALSITIGEARNTLFNLTANSQRIGFSPPAWGLFPPDTPNSSFVPTRLLSSEKLAELWDKIAAKSEEQVLLKTLKVIDPSIERLVFIKNIERDSRQKNDRIPVVTQQGSDTRIPLNSMGDGISRLLQLILSTFPARDGILLIDEFENGLHYSVQEEVWRIIFQLAKELNIQVFATTHSWDCIESFTKAAVESPEEGILLKVSRSKLTSDNGKIIATVYDEAELQNITASELEIR